LSLKLGRRIKGLRRLKGFTQQKLAHELDISVSLLSNIERGIKKPQPELLEKFVEVLEVSAEELFFLPKKKINEEIEEEIKENIKENQKPAYIK